MHLEQHVAVADLLLRHFVVHFRGLRVAVAEPVGERAVNPVVFVFVGDGQRQDFLRAEVGKTFHGLPLGGAVVKMAAAIRVS